MSELTAQTPRYAVICKSGPYAGRTLFLYGATESQATGKLRFDWIESVTHAGWWDPETSCIVADNLPFITEGDAFPSCRGAKKKTVS